MSASSTSGDLPKVRQSLPIALIRARENVMGPIREMLSDVGITEQQWRVLRVLNENGSLDATTLARRSALLLPSLTRIVNTLTSKGLTSRVADQKDRRKQQLEITSRGRKIIEDNLDQATEIANRIENLLGAKRLDELLHLLSRLDDLSTA